MKRKLMLAMTRKILQWLQDNEAHLGDIDYADDCDHCDVKTTVYKRPDVCSAWLISGINYTSFHDVTNLQPCSVDLGTSKSSQPDKWNSTVISNDAATCDMCDVKTQVYRRPDVHS